MSVLAGLFGNPNSGNFQAQQQQLNGGVTPDQLAAAQGGVSGALGQQQAFTQAVLGGQGLANQQNVFQQQQALANQLGGVAAGTGPNPALAQLQATTGQNVAAQNALMAGQRGANANVGLMARQAAQQGAATQQQAVGQGASLAAQQQLAAMQQLSGQQQAMGQLAGTQVGQMQTASQQQSAAQLQQQQQLQQQLAQYNQAAVSQQNSANQANANVASANIQSGGSLLGGGFLGNALGGLAKGAGSVIGLGAGAAAKGAAIGLEQGGEVPQQPQQQQKQPEPSPVPQTTSTGLDLDKVRAFQQGFNHALSMALGGQVLPTGEGHHSLNTGPKAKATAGSSVAHVNNIIHHPSHMEGMAQGEPVKHEKSHLHRMLKGGIVDSPKMARGAVVGEQYARQMKPVPGTARVAGDSKLNDVVDAKLSPGEIIIPRTVAQAPDAPQKAANFVAKIKARKGRMH